MGWPVTVSRRWLIIRFHEMGSSSGSPQVAEPVLQDSLSYWENQSATYDGVLGVCGRFSHVSQLTKAFICNRSRRLRNWRTLSFSISQRPSS
jgi:hypothetical protein